MTLRFKNFSFRTKFFLSSFLVTVLMPIIGGWALYQQDINSTKNLIRSNINNQIDQLEVYEKIISSKLSVRATEALVKNLNNPSEIKSSSETVGIPKPIKKGIKEFSEYFGHKIDVKLAKNGSGKISIPFHSEEDFNRIIKLVKSAK